MFINHFPGDTNVAAQVVDVQFHIQQTCLLFSWPSGKSSFDCDAAFGLGSAPVSTLQIQTACPPVMWFLLPI